MENSKNAVTTKTFEERFDIKEAAKLIGFSPITCWREIQRGHLGCYRICAGRVLLVGASHIEKYLNEREQAAFITVSDDYSNKHGRRI